MASLPPLPRKVLFVGESDIRERRTVFNEILCCISKHAELAASPELLEFLGTRGSVPNPRGLPWPRAGPQQALGRRHPGATALAMLGGSRSTQGFSGARCCSGGCSRHWSPGGPHSPGPRTPLKALKSRHGAWEWRGTSLFPGIGGQMVLSSSSTGTRSPGAADLTSREVSVLDTDSQAGSDGEAFDFFSQQEQGEGPSAPGQKGEEAGQSSEEEALDPLGIMR